MNPVEIAVREPMIIRMARPKPNLMTRLIGLGFKPRTAYKLVFTIRCVARIEARLKRSMTSPAGWLQLTVAELPVVLSEGLRKHHPRQAKRLASRICSELSTEALENIILGLCAYAFPKAMSEMAKLVDQKDAETLAQKHIEALTDGLEEMKA